MKTITAKEFRTNQTAIIKAVGSGQEYLLTSHRKPVARLLPIKKTAATGPARGSYAAVLESLKHTSPAKGELRDASYKQLRRKMVEEKYGDAAMR